MNWSKGATPRHFRERGDDDEDCLGADDDEDWISFDEPDLPRGFVPSPFGAAPVVLPKRQSKKRKKKGKGGRKR